ncbi:TIM-barrel domain-containing protein [Flavobacterium sp.]|uniref:TIM-barrel domain-containing protein n=1 Tax=Flavobacterium sp. TaxID=239 RepID=UPI003B9956D2
MRFTIRIFLLLAVTVGYAQREYQSYSNDNGIHTIRVSDGVYKIRFFSNEAVETEFIATGSVSENSLAVVDKSVFQSVKAQELRDKVDLSSGLIRVVVTYKPFSIAYYKSGQLLATELAASRTNKETSVKLSVNADESLLGGGSRVLGMNRRGNKLRLYNKAHYGYETRSELMNYCIPMYLSSEVYGVHFDNTWVGDLDLDSGKQNVVTYSAEGGPVRYQIFAGRTWKDLVKTYTTLTGRQPLPPRYVLGNFSSRFGYHSQKEAEKTIAAFKKDRIPVDAIIFDLYWFGTTIKETMGNLDVWRDSFPKFEKMISKFSKQGIKTILITEPFILKSSSKWNEAVAQGILAKDSLSQPAVYDFYFGTTGLIDLDKPKAKEWFWNVYDKFIKKGVAGWWGDLGEPEVHPKWVRHESGPANKVHNIYGHKWAELLATKYAEKYPNTRPFILMRSGYSGSQRFGMIPWSGDVNRTWGGLKAQPEIALQMGLQGLGYMHSDLGGFAGANLDDELYVRWLQYGVFQPIFRPHAQEEVASEPVFRSENAKKLARKAILERYALLPYNYSLAFENNQIGTPLMRPLFFEEPTNKSLFVNADGYLWGNDFLVVPITDAKLAEKTVYFPKTARWVDYYDATKIYEGGKYVSVKTAEDHIPVFVRSGAVIPTCNDLNVGSASMKELTLGYYYNENYPTVATVYFDDGTTTNAFEKGNYELLRITKEAGSDTVDIKSEKGTAFKAVKRKITLKIIQAPQTLTAIEVNGKLVKRNSQSANEASSFSFELTSGQEIKINLKK